jgi:hypothetical protein
MSGLLSGVSEAVQAIEGEVYWKAVYGPNGNLSLAKPLDVSALSAFVDIQAGINRFARKSGISPIVVDGILGGETMKAFLSVCEYFVKANIMQHGSAMDTVYNYKALANLANSASSVAQELQETADSLNFAPVPSPRPPTPPQVATMVQEVGPNQPATFTPLGFLDQYWWLLPLAVGGFLFVKSRGK